MLSLNSSTSGDGRLTGGWGSDILDVIEYGSAVLVVC